MPTHCAAAVNSNIACSYAWGIWPSQKVYKCAVRISYRYNIMLQYKGHVSEPEGKFMFEELS